MNGIACNFFIYDKDRVRIGEVRSITSLQWLDCLQTVGEVKLVCGATENNRRLLVRGNRIYNPERPNTIAVIREIVLDDDLKTSKMTVRAMMSAVMWDDRTVMYTEDIACIEDGILRIASHNVQDLPCTVATAKGYTDAADTQVSWGSVLDAAEKLVDGTRLGFRNTLAPATAAETFEVYKGVDRTAIGSAAYVGYLGDDSGTLKSIKIKDSDAKYKNVAVVAGRGEGAARTVVRVDLSGGMTGENLRELFVDGKSVKEKYQVTNADGTTADIAYTPAEYEAQLTAYGTEKLLKQGCEFDVAAELQQGALRLGDEYDLGDVLPLKIAKYGILAHVLILKIKIVYETVRTVSATLKLLEVI
ncbi:MAG: hypothetical protein RR825_04360 [Ruthenibacterium sp.]